MRLLLLLALLCCAIFVLRILYLRYFRSSQNGQGGKNDMPGLTEAETMIRCRECGAYFPASEAISGPSELVFCSEDHRRQHFSAH